MPYRVSYDTQLVVIVLSGELVPADLDAAADEVLAIEDNGRNTPPRLSDLRDVTDASIGYADMARLAERARTRPLSADVRSAIVVAQPVQLGFARMFQILNEHPRVTIRIFDDDQTARAWLAGGEATGAMTASTSGETR
jgi:hypothetical protein